MDRYGLHPLSCRFSAGCLPRHSELNNNNNNGYFKCYFSGEHIIKCALSSAGYNAVLEPVGLDRGDGKRPDGMTVFPFSRGKCHIWDSKCVNSFHPSALTLTATEPGSASRSTEVSKSHKYEGVCDGYIFQVIAFESSGLFGRDPDAFISQLGQLTTSISGERREAEFLHQRLSLATVRGNAQSVTQAHESTKLC